MFEQNIDLKRYVGVDLDSEAIKWNKCNLPKKFEFVEANFFEKSLSDKLGTEQFNAVVSLDVIEHIDPSREDDFCKVIIQNLSYDGCVVIGTPNINMAPYGTEANKIGHVNLYNQGRLYNLLSKYFNNVFMFGMNDEIVNVGFEPMVCYIFAVCCNKKA
jgi:2-polyprenyl-3-methyl-5-hydroxy-6-metoxy-1,4-benzoquinol methylase